MDFKASSVRILFAVLLLSVSAFSFSIQDYSLSEALKVLKAIEEIQSQQQAGENGPLKKIAVTESEFNSYIAYRIEKEGAKALKELHFKFFKGNKIEGKALIDLRGQKIPKLLRPEMTFFFGGKLDVENGKARFDMKDLFLEGRRVQLMIIDLVLTIQARIENKEPTSINDWYELPYGIKNIEVQNGRAVFYY
jgi:hypothetical protein